MLLGFIKRKERNKFRREISKILLQDWNKMLKLVNVIEFGDYYKKWQKTIIDQEIKKILNNKKNELVKLILK
jgi:hypothetical protein